MYFPMQFQHWVLAKMGMNLICIAESVDIFQSQKFTHKAALNTFSTPMLESSVFNRLMQ